MGSFINSVSATFPLFLLLITLSGCGFLSAFQKSETVSDERLRYYSRFVDSDFQEHLSSLGEDYLANPEIRELPLQNWERGYLKKIYSSILKNNELLIDSSNTPQFTIIKDEIPFYFSLPGAKFYFSSGLMKKYIKNEGLLVSIITYEMIKSLRNIYKKRIIVPTGYLRTERMLYLTRVPMEIKAELNKWTFYAMKRAGYDAFIYLNWIQTQNKNSLDFSLQQGEIRSISQEEYLFKNFIVSEGLQGRGLEKIEENSSKSFYRFINRIKRKS